MGWLLLVQFLAILSLSQAAEEVVVGSYPNVRDNILRAPDRWIRVLHLAVFHNEGDKDNRKRLLEFPGYKIDEKSKEFNDKLQYLKDNFSMFDVMTCLMLFDVVDDNYDEKNGAAYRLLDVLNYITDLRLYGKINDGYENDEGEKIQLETSPNPNLVETAEKRRKFLSNFPYFERLMTPFEGQEDYPVETWVQDFEETSKGLSLDELEKVIFAKKMLKGHAATFIRSVQGVTTWDKLKNLLMAKFNTKRTTQESISYSTDTEEDEMFVSNLDLSCLKCICAASTGCDKSYDCSREGYCGPFFISRKYWEEADRITLNSDPRYREDGHEACAKNFNCASKIVSSYMAKNGRDCNNDGITDCDDFAKIHYYGEARCENSFENTSYHDRYIACMPPRSGEDKLQRK